MFGLNMFSKMMFLLCLIITLITRVRESFVLRPVVPGLLFDWASWSEFYFFLHLFTMNIISYLESKSLSASWFKGQEQQEEDLLITQLYRLN